MTASLVCSSCKTANPGYARYCHQCGAGIHASRLYKIAIGLAFLCSLCVGLAMIQLQYSQYFMYDERTEESYGLAIAFSVPALAALLVWGIEQRTLFGRLHLASLFIIIANLSMGAGYVHAADTDKVELSVDGETYQIQKPDYYGSKGSKGSSKTSSTTSSNGVVLTNYGSGIATKGDLEQLERFIAESCVGTN